MIQRRENNLNEQKKRNIKEYFLASPLKVCVLVT